MNLINAFGLLNMIREELDDYQKEYENYIVAHKERVKQFADWLVENCHEIFDGCDLDTFYEVINEHDDSKYSEEEFEPYAQHFYGTRDNDFEFNKAWKHHYMHNEHHPEFWFGEDMPLTYILEMLCDWGSFSVEKGDYRELSKYYYEQAKDDEEKNLSDNTKEIIEEILDKINSVLDKEDE